MIDLKSISKNSPKKPRIIVYGMGGIGKTTFAANAEKPIFILTEDGLGKLDVPAIPQDENGKPTIATSYEEVIECLAALGSQEHDYKTVVIDSLDWLEPLVWKSTCKRIGKNSIEDAGYGRGYVEADNEWREFFRYVTALRDFKNMTVIMIAHGTITRVEDPMYAAYDTHGLKLHKRASAIAVEYSDVIGFATKKTLITTEQKKGGNKDDLRTRALTTGERVLYLSGTPAFTAKNRYAMDECVPLTWEEFKKQLPNGEN